MHQFRATFYFCMLMLFSSVAVFAQDTIVKRSNEIILGKVVEVGDTEINFRRQTNLNGPIYVIQISDVALIKYESGAKDIFNTANIPNQTQKQSFKDAVRENQSQQTNQPVQQQDPARQQTQEPDEETAQTEVIEQPQPPVLLNPYLQGQKDAKKYYRKHKAAGVATLISTCLAPFEFGLAGGAIKAVGFAVALSIKTPPNRKLGVPNSQYLSNTEYMRGYRDGALKKKRRKIWLNFMYPAAGYLTLFAIGIIS